MNRVLDYIIENNLNYLQQPQLVKVISGGLNMDNAEVYGLITELINEGELVLVGDHKLATAKTLNLKKGVLIGNSHGFAFCHPFDENLDDIFIPRIKLKHALNKDVVLVKTTTIDGKVEGEIVKVVKRYQGNIVGTYSPIDAESGFVHPDDNKNSKDIYIRNAKKFNPKNGDKVVVRIEKYDEKGKSPVGVMVENLGAENRKGVDILSIIREYNLYEEFPAEVDRAAKQIPQKVSPESIKGREDFRDLPIVTIDGDDAKDFDDAVNVWKTENGNWGLGVHIADVSSYVKQNDILDMEAYKRGTSVYFPDLVLPMLPLELSNGICSLNPGVDRLTLSCIMEIDNDGNVVLHKICNSVINSHARMTYNNVYKILNGDPELCKEYASFVESFKMMEQLHYILSAKRQKRGALDFDLPESEIILNEFGRVVDVKLAERNVAHRLIESFMLEANETVAKDICERKKIPFVYRVHEQPDAMKMTDFFNFCSLLGEHIEGTPEKVKPKQLQHLLDKIDGKPYADAVNSVMLRSLQKARYASKNLGHFGLAAEFYCHFTSPIRRYPDLMVHRIIKNCVLNNADSSRLDFYAEKVEEASIQSSEREQFSVVAEREVDDLKKAEFMLDKTGQTYVGKVSGISSFGVFVSLENTVEGLCGLEDLPTDNYEQVEKQYMLKGRSHSYQLGQKVKIEVLSVNLKKHQVSFKILDEK